LEAGLSAKNQQYSFRLGADRYARLLSRADGENCSAAELVRRADEQKLSASDLRVRQLSEYAQIALDTIIAKTYPELRDVIVAKTNERMVQYHGQ
jgi:hypothetical protein